MLNLRSLIGTCALPKQHHDIEVRIREKFFSPVTAKCHQCNFITKFFTERKLPDALVSSGSMAAQISCDTTV